MAARPTYSEFCSADITGANLFELYDGVKERKRTDVPVLQVTNYCVFTKALCYLIHDWLAGTVGTGAPTEPWEIDAVRKVNALNGKITGTSDQLDEETRTVYDNLVDIKVLGHFRIVTSHRRWIRGTLTFCKEIGVKFSDQMDNLIWRHDLSKYSHKEVLGYAIMFGDGRVDFRQLETDVEKFEWENTLYNHYAHNPHHPEYFYPLQEDGKTRVRDRSMRELDTVNGHDYLDESIVDMMAARGERLLAGDPVISAKKWMEISERFFGRYNTEDAKYVEEKLKEWSKMAKECLAENAEKVHGLFDKRAICYEL